VVVGFLPTGIEVVCGSGERREEAVRGIAGPRKSKRRSREGGGREKQNRKRVDGEVARSGFFQRPAGNRRKLNQCEKTRT